MAEFLEMRGIVKRFPGVLALDHVNLSVRKGEVHALLGENGAGKSTLMKILSGAYQKDEGDIFFDGQKVEINSAQDAQALNISTIYQELNLTEQLTVAENIFMGRQLMKNRFQVDWKRMYDEAQKLLDDLGVEPRTPNSQSDLIYILDERVLSGKTTIITTNYDMDALKERYGGRIFERLDRDFSKFRFNEKTEGDRA